MKDSQNAVWTPRESNEKSQTSQPTSQGNSSNHGLTRPTVRGKFLYCRDQKLWVRGITYGTFRPDEWGNEFHDPVRVKRDFALMSEAGMNALRTYTVAPRWFLDLAYDHGLYVMVGLTWAHHIAFFDDRQHLLASLSRLVDDRRCVLVHHT